MSNCGVCSSSLISDAKIAVKSASGIFCWLPFGCRVLDKIQKIIDEEQASIGFQKICMSTVQGADLWLESGRYDDYGQEMLRIKDRKGSDFLYSPTCEEQVTDIFRKTTKSYKQLPVRLYQIQWKFRDEIRPRFGVMRAREFLMKDGYSFDLTREEAIESYKLQFNAYLKTFRKMGISVIPVQADPGAIGGNLSHEFHILAETGESKLYYERSVSDCTSYDEYNGKYAVSDEKYTEEACLIPQKNLCTSNGIEVGHIFFFGTKYSKSMNAAVQDKNGNLVFPEMGSYGIGVSRLVGAIIESSHDDKGIIWPKPISPYLVHLVNLHFNDENCVSACNEIKNKLENRRVDVWFENKKGSPGEKLFDADLFGFPYQIIVSRNKLPSGIVEIKERSTGNVIEIKVDDVTNFVF